MKLAPRHALLFAAVGSVTAMSLAGPLNPPAGPIAPTMKTLTEIEPRLAINLANTPGDGFSQFKITQPGSYYLTGNITGVSGLNGIMIAASDVTLDLNGFELKGVTGSLDGIAVASQVFVSNLAVKNGTVRGWGGDGVSLSTGSALGERVESIRASNNGGAGISVGSGSVIEGCTSSFNAGPGFAGQQTCRVSGCVATNNSAHGFYLEGKCSITGCIATGSQFNGIIVDTGSIVTDCTVSQNRWDGIRISSACRVAGNTASENGYLTGGGAGIHSTGGNNRIEGNNCTGADIGIQIDAAGSFIVRNTCSDNTSNWSVASGNICYVVSALVAGSISGNNGGTSLGTSEPNANFTY